MTFTWREHAEALDEYRAAAKWYETKRPGWGDVFMDAIDSAIESILDSSIRWGFYLDRRSNTDAYIAGLTAYRADPPRLDDWISFSTRQSLRRATPSGCRMKSRLLTRRSAES